MSSRSRNVREVARGFHFLEGPRWHEGRLYFSDFDSFRVLTLDADERVETLCHVPNRPSGLGFAPNGDLMIVSMLDHKVMRKVGEDLREFADLSPLVSSPCNDMLVDTAGRAYVGHFGWDVTKDQTLHPATLLMVTPDGRAKVVADDMWFPNGVVETPDGKTLFVAESFAGRITAFDKKADGTLTNRRVWASLTDAKFTTIGEAIGKGDPVPDGLALDAEGAMWIGDAAGRGPARIAPGGKILERIETKGMTVFAVALGGEDRKTLFMCAAPPLGQVEYAHVKEAVLMSCRVDVPGIGRH